MGSHAVVYLTGAPASGKSSVAATLEKSYGFSIFSYGIALSNHPSLRGVSHEELRERSAELVSQELIRDIDESLPRTISAMSASGPVVIDSHAVTSEPWGLRAAPFSVDRLREIGISHLVGIVCRADVLASRIGALAEGRRTDPLWKLDLINGAQTALLMAYAHSLGVAPLFPDGSESLSDIAQLIARTAEVSPLQVD